MKKVFSLFIIPALLLGACGSEEAEKEPVEETVDRDGSGGNETAKEAEPVDKDVASTSTYTADDVVAAFQSEGLSLIDPRDNTDKQCGEGNMPCSQLITTEDVSIFLWPTEDEAAKIGEEYHDHTAGFFTLRFNEPLSSEDEYKRILDELVAS